MATTPNAQLTKLAVGIASVAALAGIAGQFSTKAAAPKTPVAEAAAPAPAQQPAAAATPATEPAPAEPAPAEQAPTQVAAEPESGGFFTWFGDDDDDEYEDEDEYEEHEEHEEREHGERSRSLFAQPATGGTAGQAVQQQPRTRTKHS